MKIGIDCRLWNETGVGRYIRNLVSELQKLDHKNEYVLFVLRKDYENISSLVTKTNFQCTEVDIHWHSIKEQKEFPRILESHHLDLMHFTYFSVPASYNGTFVMTMHDMIPFSFATGKASTLPLPFYFAKRVAYKIIVKKALKKAYKVIVPATAVGEDILEKISIDPSKIVVTYEGTSTLSSGSSNILSEHKLERTNYVLYVGNAYPHKNLERLLEVFLNVVAKKPEVKLVLAGKWDYFYERLTSSSAARALQESLVYINQPTDADLKQLYKHASLYISPSLMEGFALPALEAMSNNVPVVMSDIPVFREICKNAPLEYFDPTNKFDISTAITSSLDVDNKKRQNHVQLGNDLSKSFSWKKMAEETLRIYESSVSLRPSQ